MSKRVYLAILILLSVGSIVGATLVAQRATRKAKTPVRRAQSRRQPRQAPVPPGPSRPADPNRAPQNLVDDAIYTNEEFFGSQASVARPYSAALERISSLSSKYPKDARLHLHAARFSERLGQFDKAATEMTAYADLRGRSPDALRRLASFYHHRARFADEVRTLQELAKSLKVNERAPIYKRAAEIVRSRALKEFEPADFFAELVAADPGNIQPVKDYVEELRLARQYKEALAVLDAYQSPSQSKLPTDLAYYLKTRAEILTLTGDRKAAEQTYATAFDANWPRAIADDYYELLRRFGRYRIVRRALQERVRAGATDLDTVGRLFSVFSYEGNYEQAARLLTELEARRAGKNSAQAADLRNQWAPRELETVAELFASIGRYDQASRYLYTLYLVGGLQPGTGPREEALYRLFKVMLDAAGTPTRVGAGDLSFYRDVAEVDQHPGFLNGVLSLILSGTNPSLEFATEQKAAAGYFNRAFAYRVFNSFKQEYADSKHLPEMYLGIVNVFASLAEHKLAIEAGREFQKRYSDSPRYVDVSLRIADSYVALKDRTGERAVLADLLDRLSQSQPKGIPLVPVSPKHWSYGVTPGLENLVEKIRYNIEAYSDTYDPTEDKASSDDESEDRETESEVTDVDYQAAATDARRAPNYSSVLERYVSSLAADEKKTETVALFWREIKKHPKEEGLYERFMRWLGQAQLINEQLKAYDSAIKQFDSNTWYHRLSRWYVRQKRGKELTKYSRQLIGIFDEDETTEYLLRFAGYGATAAGDEMNWDERLAFDLYSYAHTRFPRNLFFVRGMLTYLEKNDRARWEKLSAEYYFADRSIREPYLAWLSKQGQLRERYARARASRGAEEQRSGGAPQPLSPSAPLLARAPSSYSVFAADAAMWLSHHDEALDAYRQLVANYPGEPQYADRLADLTRSFGQQSEKLYEESARVFAAMADIYPDDHSYRIKAGEVYAQLGDFKRAGDEWNKLTALEPGERNTYLEVATVYWDYYQFDQAVRVLKDLRNVTGDQTIYAYRLGAVYEGKGDMDSAIAEYVKVLSEPGDGRDTVSKRLAQLSKRSGLAEKIAAAYERAHAADPSNWQLAIGYASYQAEREHEADALAMLRTEVEKSSDVAFLETVRDLFRAILRPEDEQHVIARLAAVARDEREAMMYRLQLASFLERHGQVDAAIASIDKLVGEYPTNVGVVEESAQFYWRAGLLDKSLDLYKRTLARSLGNNKRSFTLLLARRQISADKLAEAEATLRAFYNDNRSDTEVFGELARTLGVENKLNDLAALYQEAFKEARGAGLGGEETGARIAELRGGMISTLDALRRYQDAVDQHIEIINSFPEDEGRLAAAIDYAEHHDLTDRLVGYYEKLSRESNKNYRWQIVLGRIYERRGNLAGASEQYRIAVVNEPQRSDLRFTLASVLARQRRYDEAIAVLRQGWTLAGRDPQWLIEVARIQVQQGARDEAVNTIRQALASKKNSTTEAQFNIAAQLAAWGLDDEAARLYAQTLAAVPKKIASGEGEYIPPAGVAGYVKVLMRSEPAASAHQKLETLRGQFAAITQNNQDYRARSILVAIDTVMGADFGKGVIDYATAEESSALASTILSTTAKLTLYSDAVSLRRYLGIAHGAGLVDVEEQIQTRLKDTAFEARPKNSPSMTPQDSAYYNELRALVTFYERHAAYRRSAEVLSAEFKRDPYKNRFDYQNQMAAQYRLAGDHDRELEWLRTAYAGASGSLTTNYTEWVDRYLSLLYAASSRSELQRLASSYSAYQLQLINFFVEKNEKLLALDAIDNAKQSAAWAKQRSGEVGFFLKDTSPETEPYFKEALAIQPIGQMLGRRLDSSQVLGGSDWFLGSRNYGYWLGLVGREIDSRRFIVGEIEGHPASSQAQIELAAYYLDKKNASRAAEHVAIAGELAPGDRDVAIMRGAVALASRDRKGALDAWGSIMNGRVTVADAQTYLRVMADNELLIESLPKLEAFIVPFVNRGARDRNPSDRVEAIKPLVRDIAERASRDPKTAVEVAAFFHNTINAIPGDLAIGRLLIEEHLLPENSLASIYRTIHQRLSDIASSVFGTPEYENGYNSGTAYVYPARELADWRKLLIDYLIRARSYEEVRLLIRTIEREQADEKLALKWDEVGSTEERYDWLPLASALTELRGSRDGAKGLLELRRYCGLETTEVRGQRPEVSEDQVPNRERCLKAYALLVAEHRESDADNLLYEAYQRTAKSRYADDASLAGLAEIEARRGRADEASRLLKRLVTRSTDNLRVLELAAETAARINRYAEAIDFRDQIARVNPGNASNKLEMARLMSVAGRAADAVDQIASVIGERTTSNTLRAQAVEVLGELVRTDRSLAQQASAAISQRARNDGAALARAAISEAMGDAEAARVTLAGVNSGALAPVAQWKLGLIALASNRTADAMASFERAIYLDADGAITNVVAFRAAGPRAQLISLYSRNGRDMAAIRLAEGEEQGSQTLITGAVRAALIKGNAPPGNQTGISFEPSLEATRSRAAGFKTLAELNSAGASSERSELLVPLIESAARLGQFDRAIAVARLRSAEAAKAEDKAAIEKRLAEIIAAKEARQLRQALLMRIDRSNATESVYSARVLGK
ncbi:MAG TPA: tetratricopeptide repeat protein [Blastocatellia bacterium]|nr:tetratricopeptide repeat protein [Blastocatellia bacterium]